MSIQVDYLIVGSGAMGMAFADVLLHETDATMAIVDRHDRPGGHWNDAYPFVRLHQPSAFYGVNSRNLGNDTVDQVGWNKGLFELASGTEVIAYFDQVMREQLLPSGRVHYFPNTEYADNGDLSSKVTGETIDITATTIVDATYMNVTVPSMKKPDYAIDPGVQCVPVNGLPQAASPEMSYIVVGAGKTGMDACLWLLRNNVTPARISWIMPRDSWMLDRANIQPGILAGRAASVFAAQLKIAAESTSLEDLFDKVGESGQLLRLTDDIEPTMYRCATVTTDELEQLRRIDNVIRMGRVEALTPGLIKLENGEVSVDEKNTLFIDCTADGLERRPVCNVFENGKITLQSVRTCQQVFSAAFIAHIEVAFSDMTEKNQLCTPVPHPDNHIDFLRTTLANTINGAAWSAHPELQSWLAQSRLDGFSVAGGGVPRPNPEMLKVAMSAMEKLSAYISEAESA
ncbi:MAG: hypothetical protein ACI8Z1_001038 [Candidatus Azotimanducaceae bacterium]|jgi:hypothetical protein